MERMHPPGNNGRFWKWGLVGALAAVVFLLWTGHQQHVLQALPFLLLLACPLMHMFHGHGDHAHGGHEHPRQQPGSPTGPSGNDDARS